MAEQAALQEAIQRARQLAAKITQSTPVKRPAPTSDHSGPVKVTLAYEKPVNADQNKHHAGESQRESSKDHNRNDRDSRDSRPQRDYRDDSRERESRRDSNDRHTNHSSGSMLGGAGMTAINTHQQSDTIAPPIARQGEEKIELIIPHAVIGLVIGKGGENIKRIQNESGATVRVDPATVDDKGNKLCTITGTKQAVDEAHVQVMNVIESAATGKRPRLHVDGSDSFRMKIPASRTGAIIGKGGETIKSIKQQSGCDIEPDKGAKECGPEESVFIIRGTKDKIMKASALIEARLAQGRGGGRDGRDGPKEHNHHADHHSSRSGSKNFATGANAAPVAPYPDLPASYPAAGQQNSADASAAWAAYFAQYSTLFNQAGAQPAATNAATAPMPYAGQSNLLGTTPVSTTMPTGQQIPPQHDQPQQTQVAGVDPSLGAQGQQDFSDQWIEYYLANGRPDYAEQIIQMKKQQQAQKQ